MSYKKYIKRGGKIYGPYIYHSLKINGRVTSEYLGKGEKESNKKRFLIIFSILIASLFLLLILLPNFNTKNTLSKSITGFRNLLTGFSVSEELIDSNYSEDSLLDLCAEINCENSTLECPDGFITSCLNLCDLETGVCDECVPDCSGHDIVPVESNMTQNPLNETTPVSPLENYTEIINQSEPDSSEQQALNNSEEINITLPSAEDSEADAIPPEINITLEEDNETYLQTTETGKNCIEFQDNVLWSSGYTLNSKGSVNYQTWHPKNDCSKLNLSGCFIENIKVQARFFLADSSDLKNSKEGYVQISNLHDLNCNNPESGDYSKYLAYDSLSKEEKRLNYYCNKNKQGKCDAGIDYISGKMCYGIKSYAPQYMIVDVFSVNYTLCSEKGVENAI